MCQGLWIVINLCSNHIKDKSLVQFEVKPKLNNLVGFSTHHQPIEVHPIVCMGEALLIFHNHHGLVIAVLVLCTYSGSCCPSFVNPLLRHLYWRRRKGISVFVYRRPYFHLGEETVHRLCYRL